MLTLTIILLQKKTKKNKVNYRLTLIFFFNKQM